MKIVDVETENQNFHSQQNRRGHEARRVSEGRRDFIRFDDTGGDRRTGAARRVTDDGFRFDAEEGYFVSY